ncbi:MAG: metallopeptidase TldD-related protein [Sulfolobales archaeon]
MIKRRDVVSISRWVDEVVIEGSSISRRRYSTSILSVRQLLGGCWFTSTCVNCSDVAELSSELESIVKVADLESCTVPDSFEVEFYTGKLTLGTRTESSDIISSSLSLLKEYKVPEYEPTLTIRRLRTIKTIRADDSTEAYEEKNLVEIEASLRYREGLTRAAPTTKVLVQGLDKGIESAVEEAIRLARHRAKAMSLAKRPSITEVGKSEVILTREASPAFFHHLSHLLVGPRAREIVGRRLFEVSGMRIYDSPGDLRKPTARFFDDEGVVARRRWLVEGFSVIDTHHNIRTAYEAGSSPGSAHGVLGRFKLLHTSLVVESGDWKDDELFEETKRGFVIDGVNSVLLELGSIRLIPQSAVRLERGDLGEPVFIKAVKVPITRPVRVLGVGRTSYTTYSRESEDIIVSETSPPIKIEAFIEV